MTSRPLGNRQAPARSALSAFAASLGAIYGAGLVAIAFANGWLAGVWPAGLLTERMAHAAEFAVPPGQNVGMQEDVLRERVTRIAKDLVGDKLVTVVASVAYIRTDRPTGEGAAERIKLPGLNNYISTRGDRLVTPEFLRLRQVVVVVTDDLAGKTAPIERDIRAQADFDPAKGDRLEVVTVATAGSHVTARPGEPGAEVRPVTTGPEPTLGKDRKPETAPVVTEADALREPKSTLYLINARAAYFRGDYNQALDQIMQSINAKPDNPQAYAMLGSLYFAMNWKDLALKYWEKALAQDPGNRELEQLVTQLRTAQN